MCEGGGAGGCQDPPGRVCQASSHPWRGPHQKFICSRLELEASSEAVLADVLDVLNLCSGNPGFSRVMELLQKYHQSVALKVSLPLVELEAAKVDLHRFLQECLHELGSGPQAQEELGEITRWLLGYNHRVAEIVQETPGVE